MVVIEATRDFDGEVKMINEEMKGASKSYGNLLY